MTCVAQGYRRSVAAGVETGSVQAGELEFAYVRAGGDGPLALCLHGFPDTPHTWRHLLPRLAEHGYRAVAPFSRGYAPTGVPSDGVYQTGALAADANALHEALGGDGDAVIIGHDWGAAATYGAAAHEPRSVGAGSSGWPSRPRGAVAAAFVSNVDQLQRSWYMFFFQHPLSDLIVAGQRLRLRRAAVVTVVARLRRIDRSCLTSAESLADPANLQAALGYYRAALGNGPIDPRFEQTQAATSHVPPQPTLYLHGRDDGAIGVEVAEAAAVMTADDEHVTIEVLDGCGHFLHLERPDAVNERVAGVPVVSARPNLPDGLVVVVKEECETCRMVAPLLPSIAEHGPLTVYTQDDPAFPKELEARARRRPRSELAPRHRDGADADARGRRRRGRAHGRLVAERVAAHHRDRRPRRRSPCHATGLRVD